VLITPRRGLRALVALGLVTSLPASAASPAWQSQTQGRCTVRSHGQPLASELLRLCHEVLPRVSVFAGWKGRVLVVLPASTAELQRLAPEAGDMTDVAAVATVDRVLVDPESYLQLSATGRQVVLAHELTHLALRSRTTRRTPLWLVEGIADEVGLRGSGLADRTIAQELADEVRRGVVPRTLPNDADFGGPRMAQAYEQAWLAVDLLARRYGDKGLLAFYVHPAWSAADTAAWRADLVRRLA
jgi:hypothetical protein